jgi:hypothetical protein
MRRLLASACALAVALGAGATAPSSFAEGDPEPSTTPAVEPDIDIGNFLLGEIARYRKQTWHWERLMGIRRTRGYSAAERRNDREHRILILNAWKTKAAKRRRQAWNPPRLRAWLCIHRHERHPRQGWASATGNGYYGGLQMDISFQRRYGADLLRRKGTANRWTALEQIWVAERAFRSGRGFYPWPNTARYCGLL